MSHSLRWCLSTRRVSLDGTLFIMWFSCPCKNTQIAVAPHVRPCQAQQFTKEAPVVAGSSVNLQRRVNMQRRCQAAFVPAWFAPTYTAGYQGSRYVILTCVVLSRALRCSDVLLVFDMPRQRCRGTKWVAHTKILKVRELPHFTGVLAGRPVRPTLSSNGRSSLRETSLRRRLSSWCSSDLTW